MSAVLAISGVVVKELYRRKDFYALFVLTALIALLLGAQNFFGEARIVRYLKEICLLLVWLSGLAIAVGTAARQMPAERENRTILPLLAKPVTRAEVIAGKFLGCWTATGIALGLFYLLVTVMAGAREDHWFLANYLQALWLQWIMLGIVIALTLLGSLIFAAPSSNATIILVVCVGILLFGRHLNQVALGLPEPGRSIVYAIYFLLPHLEFFDIRALVVHDLGRAPLWAWLLATLYGLAYTAFFLLASWLVFRRTPLN